MRASKAVADPTNADTIADHEAPSMMHSVGLQDGGDFALTIDFHRH